MSTTVDQRVVEMRFDNKHFERNVQTSLSTLDKLKQKLNLSGATKGLEDVNNAAKKIDISPLGKAVETVNAKFSAMEVMAVTALANITNSAVNAGKRMISALTIDPIKTGLSEYETKMNAIQVIQANTRDKNTMEDITSALNELNDYADKTIYNFAQMTSNVGKFTAQGYDVAAATNAVKGLANLAAASGASAEDMARATYQMSQSLGGTIKLMDWNSLRNANMATQDLKNTLIDLAKVNGIAIDDMIAKHGTFEQTLSEGWLSGEMFTKAMNIYSGIYSDAELAGMGFTKSQIENFKELAAMAESSATEVKTFTQLWDVLKETAQSGWTQTWELIIGDFETAKTMLTKAQNYFSGIINAFSDARNWLLGGALKFIDPWTTITKKLESSGLNKIAGVAEKIGDVADKVKYFQEVVNSVWMGDYKNSDTGRFELLEKAGYDHRVVQDLVNKGYQYEITIEDIEASHKKFGLTMEKTTETTEGATAAFDKLSREQLKNAGLTEDEIDLYMDLAEEAERTGTTIDALAKEMSERDGRTLLIESLQNAWSGLVSVFTAVRDAWVDIFPPMSIVQLYNIIKAINQFSQRLIVSEESAGKLTRVFKGLFAVLDIVATLAGGALKVAWKVLDAVLSGFGTDILTVAANLGDLLVKFRDWIDEHNIIFDKIEDVARALKNGIDTVKEWVDGFMKLPEAQEALGKLRMATGKLITDLREHFKGGKEVIAAFIERVKDVDSLSLENIKKIFKDFKDNVLGYFFDFDGMFDGFTTALENLKKLVREKLEATVDGFDGFRSKLTGNFKATVDVLTDFKDKVFAFVEGVRKRFDDNIGLGELLTIFLGGGLIVTVNKIGNALGNLTNPFANLGDVFESFGKTLNAFALKTKSQALINIAIAIAILAASIAALTFLDQGKMWSAVGAIAVLGVALIGLCAALGMVGKIGGLGKVSQSLVAMSASLLILVYTLKKMEELDGTKVVGNVLILVTLSAALALVSRALGQNGTKIASGAITILAIAAALRILVGALEQMGNMRIDSIGQMIIVLVAAVASLAILSKACKGVDLKSAVGMLAAVLALKLLVSAFKSIANLDVSNIKSNMEAFITIFGIFALLMISSKLAGKNAAKAGVGILAMSAALILIALAMKIIGTMDLGDLGRATDAVSQLLIVFGVVTALSALAGKNAAKAGVMLLAMSAAILILAGVIVVLSHIDPTGLDRALGAITTLQWMFALLIGITKIAGDCTKTLVLIATTLGILAIALGALSMIDPENLKGATIAMGVVMAMFAIIMKVSGSAQQAAGSLGAMIGVIIAVGAVLIVLTECVEDANQALAAAAAISLVMLALSAALLIVSKADDVTMKALGTLVLMTGIAALLGVVLGALGKWDLNASIETAGAISLLMLALSGAMFIMSKAGDVGLKAIGSLALMVVIAGLTGAIMGLLEKYELAPSIETAVALSTLLLGMSGACVILSKVGPLAMNAIYGVLGLIGVIAILGAFIMAVGGLIVAFPDLEYLLDKGIPILEKIGIGLGSFVGGIVAGFTTSALAGLAMIAQGLSDFIGDLGPFLDGIKDVDPASLQGVKALAETLLILTAAEILDGLTSWFTGGASFAEFADQLSELGPALKQFAADTAGIDASSVESAANAANMLAEMASNLPNSGGVVSWFMGENNMDVFGAQLVSFGASMVNFSNTLTQNGGINEEAITAAANAGSIMAEMAGDIPNFGGVVGWFCGDNDMATFGAQLVSFGASIVAFSTAVAGKINEEAILAAANTGSMMSRMAADIPNYGGVVSWFCGDNDMATFGAQIVAFGNAIVAFSATVNGKINEEAILAAANAGSLMSQMASDIPQFGGVVSWFCGDNKLDKFGKQIVAFGESIVGFSNTLTEGNIDADAVAKAKNAGEVMIELANSVSQLEGGGWGDDTTTLKDFGKHLKSFGEALKDFASDTEEVNSSKISSTVAAMATLSNWCKGLSGIDPEWATAFKDSLGELGETGIDKLIETFENSGERVSLAVYTLFQAFMEAVNENRYKVTSAIGTIMNEAMSEISDYDPNMKTAGERFLKQFVEGMKAQQTSIKNVCVNLINQALTAVKELYDDFKSAGKTAMSKFLTGMSEKNAAIKNAASTIANNALSKMNDKYSSFYSAGVYVSTGFANGISAGSYLAENAATAVVNAALDAIEEAAGIQSPSKEAYKRGDFFGMGFTNALGEYRLKAYDEAYGMADSATNGLSNAISKVRDFIDSDMDTEPTIRPVLDLSAVKSGVGVMSGMFGLNPSVGVLSNVGSISAMMNSNQNGGNDDIISAINDLGSKIGNASGDSYNVNGITYDDGSNISDAVKSLVRAARVERRI